MDSTVLSPKADVARADARKGIWARWFTGRQGQRIREALLAYAFLLPAILIVGTFGLFPLLFAAYESTLTGLNKIVGNYDGLGNYVKAIGNLTYVLGFWLSVLLLYLAGKRLVDSVHSAREKGENPWKWVPAGIAFGTSVVLFTLFIFRLLPALLEIPTRMRREGNTQEVFNRLLGEAILNGNVQRAFWAAVLLFIVGIVLVSLATRRQTSVPAPVNLTGAFTAITVMVLGAVGLTWLTLAELNKAYAEAREAGEGLDIWSQILTISAGFLLLLIAWWLWESASQRETTAGTAFRLGAAAMLLVGGWFLIGELPRAIGSGDGEWWLGVLATFYYSAGTIPLQLGISLLLATLLFQEIRGKSLFRIVYFIPYIAPFVGTAAVFRIIFSQRPSSPVNSFLTTVGMDPLKWLNDPTGIFQMIVGPSVELPLWAAGPSLALVVIILYGTWTFIGFNTVIFMAGLGSIPREIYEAGAIDGAGRWALFRNITLPLLSPTIYFLTLYSVIGTFKAFNHIYVLRTAAALGTTDTASVVIFQAFRRDTRFGYASALAILLLLIILALTAVNNRIASKRVFYG